MCEVDVVVKQAAHVVSHAAIGVKVSFDFGICVGNQIIQGEAYEMPLARKKNLTLALNRVPMNKGTFNGIGKRLTRPGLQPPEFGVQLQAVRFEKLPPEENSG